MENTLESFDEDLLDRRVLAENLTKIIENTNDINVIAIDSAWGTGKTTFIKMWQHMLNTEEDYKDKFETLYFNAWENDYIKDPLLAFISEIEKQMGKDNNKAKEVLKYIKDNGKKLIKPIGKTIIKLLTNGILDLDKIKLDDFTKDEITNLMGEMGEISIQEIVREKEIRSKFIKDLENIINKNKCEIVFFIDELDRCRPCFAIELLEVIKHLFSIKNVTFIISVDKEQLAHSISTLYGQDMDSDGYLRRFFDIEYKIPVIDKRQYIGLKNKVLFENYKNTNFLEEFLRELFIRDMYSFRDINKTYDYIKLLMPTIKEFNYESKRTSRIYIPVYSYILAEMINIKIKHNNIYKKIINLEYNHETSDIENMLKFNDVKNLQFKVQSFTEESLKQLISSVMEIYLLVIKLTNNGSKHINVSENEEEKYIVGFKKEDGFFQYGYQLNILDLVRNKELDFISKLEFLNDFI